MSRPAWEVRLQSGTLGPDGPGWEPIGAASTPQGGVLHAWRRRVGRAARDRHRIADFVGVVVPSAALACASLHYFTHVEALAVYAFASALLSKLDSIFHGDSRILPPEDES